MKYSQTLMYSEIMESSSILKELVSINKATVEAAVEEINAKKLTLICGAARGTSNHAMQYFKRIIEIFSPFKLANIDCSNVTVYGGKSDYSNSVVIGVSQSGKAVDVLEVLNKANKQGAVTISVTNDLQSPMAKTAKYHFYCGCGEEKSVAATKTFNAQSYLLTYFAAALSGEKILNEVLDIIPKRIAQNINIIEGLASQLAQEIKDIEEGFVLSRGITQALAMECALKMQETCYVKLSAYPYSEFQHGPMAMVKSGETRLLVFAPVIGFLTAEQEQSNLSRLREFLKKMNSLGAKCLVVSGQEGFKEFGKVFQTPPCDNEMVSFFDYALLAQQTACQLSCLKGNNPDTPRALNKVTITK